jgi:hypothetical protein
MSIKSNKNKASKENVILMRLRMPELVAIAIPENKPGSTTPVEISIHFKNNTSSDLQFINLVPRFLAPDGQTLKQKESGTPVNNWGLIRRGLPIGITLKGRIYWQNNSLQIEIPTNSYHWEAPPITPENSWTFDSLLPGIYKLSFVCENQSIKTLYSNLAISEFSDVNLANLSTNEVNLYLIEPLESNKAVVEVNGIRFETFISKQVFNIRQKEPGATDQLKLAGIRITNNTPNPVRFSFYVTIIPEIVKADGQILFRGYFSDWSRQAEESDFVLVLPGKDVIFFPKTLILWQQNDQIQLLVDAEDGGAYTFDVSDLGTYKIQLNYVNTKGSVKIYDQEIMKWKQIENIWMGMVTTPLVEFRLTRL